MLKEFQFLHTTYCRNCGRNFPYVSDRHAKGKACRACGKSRHYAKKSADQLDVTSAPLTRPRRRRKSLTHAHKRKFKVNYFRRTSSTPNRWNLKVLTVNVATTAGTFSPQEELKGRFDGIGKIKDKQIKLHIDSEITPKQPPHRAVFSFVNGLCHLSWSMLSWCFRIS